MCLIPSSDKRDNEALGEESFAQGCTDSWWSAVAGTQPMAVELMTFVHSSHIDPVHIPRRQIPTGEMLETCET